MVQKRKQFRQLSSLQTLLSWNQSTGQMAIQCGKWILRTANLLGSGYIYIGCCEHIRRLIRWWASCFVKADVIYDEYTELIIG